MLGPRLLLLLTGAMSLTVAAPIDSAGAKRSQLDRRVELYPAPDLGRIKVDDNLDKRTELYPAPDLGRIKVDDDLAKRTELYPAPDLGRIKVDDEVEKQKREELYPAPDLGRIKVDDEVRKKRDGQSIYTDDTLAIYKVKDDEE